ncbi:MAG TPA: Na+/H+ antiporter subunit G [Nitrospira sp.]|nr:Na+/H+ antiporter subunit G [Nitrospira sp.]
MLEFFVSALLLVGSFFILVGAVSLVRLPDFFMRLHGPTKATTLGVGGMLLAAVVHAVDGFTVRELLITLFLFVTAPVSAYLLGQVGLRRRVTSRAPLPKDFSGLRP